MQERRIIMVVEDEPSVRQLIAEMLRDAGHDVVECAGGEEALRVLDSVQPALITLDLAMPSMDGFQFLGLVRSRPGMARVPVVFITAAPEFLREQIAEQGEPVIGKPFLMGQLLEAIEGLLAPRTATD